jgi:hypothetical protein
VPPTPSVLAADALTTLPNLKEVLGISGSDTSKDQHLERVINRVTLWVEDVTRRKLKARRYGAGFATTIHPTTNVADETYLYFSGSTKDQGGDTVVDERGYGLYYLPAYPVQANAVVTFQLATLSDRGSDVSGGESWDTADLAEWDDYVVDRENGVLRLLHGRFSTGFRNYRIQMAAGYQTGSAQPYVPADLEGLCLDLCRQLYRDSRNLQSESIGTWSRTYNLQVKDPFQQDLLARYTRQIL